jgi:hypothetical protein
MPWAATICSHPGRGALRSRRTQPPALPALDDPKPPRLIDEPDLVLAMVPLG